jgi:hypothetical protein
LSEAKTLRRKKRQAVGNTSKIRIIERLEVVSMLRRSLVVSIVIVGLIGLVAVAQRTPILQVKPLVLREPGFYLMGNLGDREGIVETEKGRQRTSFMGSIGFRVLTQEKETLQVVLSRLNLVSKGVPTENGESGVIGLSLAASGFQLEYNPRTGEVGGEFETILHYELIDRVRGYREQECKGECDLFEPYTERMIGKLSGKFAEPLELAEKGEARFEGELTLELSSRVLGVVHRIYVVIVVIVDWTVFQPADVLRIQPVFIGSGASDPNVTGTAFNTLMNNAHNMWNRCGSVRCIKFVVNEPIYINNSAYRVLDSSSEAANLRAEVSVANAVEVFVVERMSTSLACSWGGGACFSSGTASAKIVSCDQQMAVPCPCPSACTGYCPCGACLCGAINPYHLAHELGHALNLAHPPGPSSGLAATTVNSIMEPSGFCCDNPNAQSAKNCRNASNPLLFLLFSICSGSPDIND